MGWISVKDRLPGNNDDVLVLVEDASSRYVCVARMHDDGLFVNDRMTYWGLSVTHWMPLPEPPED